MQLNPLAFNAHLNNMGEWFRWRKSSACPCITPSSGAPKVNCPHCGGKGRMWEAPVRALAGVASQKTQQEWAKFGQWESGDLVISIPEDSPLYEVAPFDRVVAETSSDPFSMPLVRGAPNERIPGAIEGITRVYWFNQAGEVVEGKAPTLSATGVPSWSDGGAPPVGTTYSLSGSRYQEFYCFGQFPNNRMKHAGARLPLRMVMRSFDLLGR